MTAFIASLAGRVQSPLERGIDPADQSRTRKRLLDEAPAMIECYGRGDRFTGHQHHPQSRPTGLQLLSQFWAGKPGHPTTREEQVNGRLEVLFDSDRVFRGFGG